MPVFRALLVPTDGSEQSVAACALATRIAGDQDASIVFLNVVEADKVIASAMAGQGFTDPGPALETLRQAGTQLLRDAVGAAQTAGVKASSQLEQGASVDTILNVAISVGADLIVMGSHGRGGVARLMLGSVAEGVLRNGTTPVLVTKAHKA
jgi:nucleotide-binding universal stress UspA family protein